MKRVYFIFLVFFVLETGISQDILSLKEAKSIALSQNYQVALSENNMVIATTKTKLEEASKKPTLGVNAGLNGNLNNSNIKYYAMPESNTNWLAPSLAANVGASASYLLWDSQRTNNRIKQSIAEEKLTQIEYNATKQDILYRVENTYLNLSRMNENRNILEEAIRISQQRKTRTTYSFEYGSGDKLAVLNAAVDLNKDSVNLLKFEQQYINAKRNLNLVLNRDFNTNYQIESEQTIDENLSLEDFFSIAKENNIQLQEARQNLNISAYDKKINNSNLKPLVKANASYGINYSDNTDISPVDYSLGDGLRLGLSMNWNISDGGRTKHLNQLSELKIKSQKLFIQQIEDQILLQITNAWGDYKNALLVYHLEEKNLTTAEENFSRSEVKFKNGQINSITFRQAQLNYLLAKLNLSSAKYDALLVVLDLKLWSGTL